MILQSLTDYYRRKQEAEPEALPPQGFEKKEIHFLIVLDADGSFVRLQDVRVQEGKQFRGRLSLVPQAVKRSSGVAANLLWDNVGYVLGYDNKGKPERVRAQFIAFRDRIAALLPNPESDEGIRAVLRFLDDAPLARVSQDPSWPDLVESNGNVSFQIEGETRLVCQRPAVVAAIEAAQESGDGELGLCLVSGERDAIARLHWPIKGVYGAKTTGGDIVSFNLPAATSRGKQQGANAPVGARATFAYTAALNYLLRRDSRQKLQLGDATLVFWSEAGEEFENIFAGAFSDDPDFYTEAVSALYASLQRGTAPVASDERRFYLLGLAPNAARLAVRLWQVATVAEIGQRLFDHFKRLELVHGEHESGHLPLRRLLRSIATQGKDENVPPNLAADTIRAIVSGLPYPRTLLSSAIRRCQVEHEVTFPRAALIKACLNQTRQRNPQSTDKEMTVALDKDNTNVGYRLGRLFALLEQVQRAANPGITNTLRDRFFATASSTPAAAFVRLLRLNTYHLAKLRKEKPRLAGFFEKMIGEVMDGIGDIPGLLKLEDQGRFTLGYYHQHQARNGSDAEAATEPETI